MAAFMPPPAYHPSAASRCYEMKIESLYQAAKSPTWPGLNPCLHRHLGRSIRAPPAKTGQSLHGAESSHASFAHAGPRGGGEHHELHLCLHRKVLVTHQVQCAPRLPRPASISLYRSPLSTICSCFFINSFVGSFFVSSGLPASNQNVNSQRNPHQPCSLLEPQWYPGARSAPTE